MISMKVAVLYQANKPPVIDGIVKPMKPGGYSDSGADIAYCLVKNGIPVALPVKSPDVLCDTDWCFPDTKNGIEAAVKAGADTLWLNTVLYSGHPVESFGGIYAVGQRSSDVSLYDDKYRTNSFLRQCGLAAVNEQIVCADTEYDGDFPCVLKPIRGRGSQGVVKCGNRDEFEYCKNLEINKKIYGDKLMAEEYLSGSEVTLSVLPGKADFPFVERFNHKNGIAPYSGDVPVEENSRVVLKDDDALRVLRADCNKAVELLDLKGLVRIDCRADVNGRYKMFDFNLKPNMTGAVRSHRMNQSSLTAIAAKAVGMSYFDLLCLMPDGRWEI